MAFDTNGSNDNGNNRGGRSNGGDDWKADFFLNLSLPSNTETGKAKLVGIPLQKKNPRHAKLIAALQKGDEKEQAETMKRMLSALTGKLESAAPNENAAFTF